MNQHNMGLLQEVSDFITQLSKENHARILFDPIKVSLEERLREARQRYWTSTTGLNLNEMDRVFWQAKRIVSALNPIIAETEKAKKEQDMRLAEIAAERKKMAEAEACPIAGSIVGGLGRVSEDCATAPSPFDRIEKEMAARPEPIIVITLSHNGMLSTFAVSQRVANAMLELLREYHQQPKTE